MKKRYVYSLLFGIPGLFISGVISIFALGAIMGILWLFVFGDHPWPVPPEIMLPVFLVLIFLISWIAFISMGYMMGKQREKDSAMNWGHVLISVGLTLAFILFIVFQQWMVGNIGPKSDSMLCSEFCVQHGYSGSGMLPQNAGDRTCSCYDASGNEVMTVPLDTIATGIPR